MAGIHLVLGGQKSGKSRRAEMLAREWLAASTDHRATLIATGLAHDEEMAERIARHRQDRAQRVPGMATLEEPLLLAEKIAELTAANHLLVIDCMMIWLVNLLMPLHAPSEAVNCEDRIAALADALSRAQGPIVLISNEIGLGVIPMGKEARQFVDTLGTLNQRIAAMADSVTLMAAGLPMSLKGAA